MEGNHHRRTACRPHLRTLSTTPPRPQPTPAHALYCPPLFNPPSPQVLMFSATLHSPEVKRLAAAICQQPMLVDLKGKDAVPDSVDHVLLRVDPTADATWLQSTPKVGRLVCLIVCSCS